MVRWSASITQMGWYETVSLENLVAKSAAYKCNDSQRDAGYWGRILRQSLQLELICLGGETELWLCFYSDIVSGFEWKQMLCQNCPANTI